jgi:hypothetical protein
MEGPGGGGHETPCPRAPVQLPRVPTWPACKQTSSHSHQQPPVHSMASPIRPPPPTPAVDPVAPPSPPSQHPSRDGSLSPENPAPDQLHHHLLLLLPRLVLPLLRLLPAIPLHPHLRIPRRRRSRRRRFRLAPMLPLPARVRAEHRRRALRPTPPRLQHRHLLQRWRPRTPSRSRRWRSGASGRGRGPAWGSAGRS